MEDESPTDAEIIPSIEASISNENTKAEARFFFTQAFFTTYQTIGTHTLSTWPSCYTTEAGVTTCSSSSVNTSGRKKREKPIVEEAKPMVQINGEMVDFGEYIKASRVSRHNNDVSINEYSEHEKNIPRIFEASIEDVPQCLKGALEARRNERQLVTVTSTITSFTYATATVTVDATQRFEFKSSDNTNCFPSQLVSSLGISRC